MRSIGLDIGSRSVKLVLLEEGRIAVTRIADTGPDPLAAGRRLLEGLDWDCILATGYGRNRIEAACEIPTVTEIKAHAVGARRLFPGVCAVLDIGGQDTKAIALGPGGQILAFEMNDRCAAGTGKFLEVMARTLGFALEEFAAEALRADRELTIHSLCTVFAESEVTSLLAQGEDRRGIARGLHRAIARRAAGMLARVSREGPVAFTGGAARNGCLSRLLEELLKRPLLVPEAPELAGALGAAWLASRPQPPAPDRNA
ncbi:MAG: acyl-CoA dehydratase activase [Desulfobacterales bacterium]